jgi:hypothetical protein
VGGRAESDLAFIRLTMERAGRFTGVPGWGGLFMGAVALIATALCLTPAGSADERWPLVWLGAAAVACPLNAVLLARKARRQGASLLRGRGRAFLLGLCPPLVAGAVLTAVLWQAGRVDLLPPTWLLVYGAAVMAAGATSIRVVPVLGACFLALGVVAAVAPAAWGVALLGIGFGGLHAAFGLWIGVRHGG